MASNIMNSEDQFMGIVLIDIKTVLKALQEQGHVVSSHLGEALTVVENFERYLEERKVPTTNLERSEHKTRVWTFLIIIINHLKEMNR